MTNTPQDFKCSSLCQKYIILFAGLYICNPKYITKVRTKKSIRNNCKLICEAFSNSIPEFIAGEEQFIRPL